MCHKTVRFNFENMDIAIVVAEQSTYQGNCEVHQILPSVSHQAVSCCEQELLLFVIQAA